MKILVTGASGFIGAALMRRLEEENACHAVGSRTRLSAEAEWAPELEHVEIIVHCAARVHIMRDKSSDSLAIFRAINVEGTLRLARQAAAAGVKRFIFISSIKVNGEETQIDKPFSADDLPNPQDAYGISKREAEDGLREIANSTGMEVTIIRPPLVYGPGAKGNFASLVRLVRSRIPLPLAAIKNRRSLVGLDNLVDLIVTCLTHREAANQTFLVSDGHDLSTPELLSAIASALGIRLHLFYVPTTLINVAAQALGMRDLTRRLCGSLQVDISKTTSHLGWTPPHQINRCLAKL